MRHVSMIVKGCAALIAVLVLTGLPTWAQPTIEGVNIFRLANGSASLPAWRFIQDPDSGCYRIGADNVGCSAGGTLRWDWNASRILTAVDVQLGATNLVKWGTTSSFPALKRSSTELQVRLADDSANAPIRALYFNLNGTGVLSSSSDGVWLLADSAGTSFGRLQFGGTTTSFPALARSGAALDVMLADASANAALRHTFIIEAVTTSKSPSATENNECYTNTGDADGTTFTLPNDPAAGSTYCFVATVAQAMTISPNTGETIRDNGSTCSDVRIGAAIGESLRLIAATGGSGAMWVPLSNHGGFTCTP